MKLALLFVLTCAAVALAAPPAGRGTKHQRLEQLLRNFLEDEEALADLTERDSGDDDTGDDDTGDDDTGDDDTGDDNTGDTGYSGYSGDYGYSGYYSGDYGYGGSSVYYDCLIDFYDCYFTDSYGSASGAYKKEEKTMDAEKLKTLIHDIEKKKKQAFKRDDDSGSAYSGSGYGWYDDPCLITYYSCVENSSGSGAWKKRNMKEAVVGQAMHNLNAHTEHKSLNDKKQKKALVHHAKVEKKGKAGRHTQKKVQHQKKSQHDDKKTQLQKLIARVLGKE